jgi:hypothetical protein
VIDYNAVKCCRRHYDDVDREQDDENHDSVNNSQIELEEDQRIEHNDNVEQIASELSQIAEFDERVCLVRNGAQLLVTNTELFDVAVESAIVVDGLFVTMSYNTL